MNMKKMKLTAIISALILLLPISSEAYFTTSQSATKMSADTALYTISFDFGFPSRDLYMPIGAVLDTEASTSPYIEYEMVNTEGEAITSGKTSAIVLTGSKDIQIKDNQYFLPAGKGARFTLVALLTIPENFDESEVALHVSSLPFTMVDGKTSIAAHLNPSELQYYLTPTINFGTVSGIVTSSVHTLSTK